MNNLQNNSITKKQLLQFLCLFIVFIGIFLTFLFQQYLKSLNLTLFLQIPLFTALFIGLSLSGSLSKRAKTCFAIGILFIIWFWLLQPIHYLEDSSLNYYDKFIGIYLLALPFASATEDGQRQWGLKLAAVVAIGVSLALLGCTLLLMLGKMPSFFADTCYFDGPRLCLFVHPNICANLLLIGIGSCLYLCFNIKKKLGKLLFILLAATFFVPLSMTNCRSVILLTAVLIGSAVLIRFLPALKGKSIARAVFTLLTLAASVLIFWKLSRILYGLNDHGVASSITQHSMSSDMFSLNNRTSIYLAAIKALIKDPYLLLFGTDQTYTHISPFLWGTVAHTHNSWLEILFYSGLLGLAFSLILTFIALRSIIRVLFSRHAMTSGGTKILSVLCVMLLAHGFIEPFLFTGMAEPINFFFMLILGYLWEASVGSPLDSKKNMEAVESDKFSAKPLKEDQKKKLGLTQYYRPYRLSGKSKNTGYSVMKRCFDFLFSAVVFLILLPLLLILMLLIFVDDPTAGPIYCQTRIGKNGKPFTLYKLRSMYPNADSIRQELKSCNEAQDKAFKIKADPRITNVGHYIRKFMLDELPQLINVMLGQMSLIGPRPPLPDEVATYDEYDKQRLSITPGLTCIWQTFPHRHEVSFEDWVAMDLQYIENRSLKTDIILIFKTIKTVFSGSGA